jgi:hypothetical protein
VANQLLLLGVNGYYQLLGGADGAHGLGDVLELGVAINVGRPFERLAIGLKRVAGGFQQGANHIMADACAERDGERRFF